MRTVRLIIPYMIIHPYGHVSFLRIIISIGINFLKHFLIVYNIQFYIFVIK